jgi:hypothetical protein
VEQASAIGVLRLTPFQMIAHIHWAVHGPARQLHRSDPESRADETTNWPCIPTSGTSTWHGRRTTSSRANTDHYTRRAPICQASPRFLLGCKRRHSSFSGTLQTSSATTGCAWAAAKLVNHSSASGGKDHRGRRNDQALDHRQAIPKSPAAVDRAGLLQLLRILAEAIPAHLIWPLPPTGRPDQSLRSAPQGFLCFISW